MEENIELAKSLKNMCEKLKGGWFFLVIDKKNSFSLL